MISENFFKSKTAIVTLLAACFVVLISLGVRQVFGLFFIDFNESLNISNTAFGFAIGIQSSLFRQICGNIFSYKLVRQALWEQALFPQICQNRLLSLILHEGYYLVRKFVTSRPLTVPPSISNSYAGNTCITYFVHKL